MTDKTLLSVRGVTKRFGGLTALSDVSFDIHRGEIVGLIGPNGAGKTTMFNVLTGLYPHDEGEIFFQQRCAWYQYARSNCRQGHCPYFSKYSFVPKFVSD